MSHESDPVMKANAERVIRLWRAMRSAAQDEAHITGFTDAIDRQYDAFKNSMTVDKWEETVALADEMFKLPDKEYLNSLN